MIPNLGENSILMDLMLVALSVVVTVGIRNVLESRKKAVADNPGPTINSISYKDMGDAIDKSEQSLRDEFNGKCKDRREGIGTAMQASVASLQVEITRLFGEVRGDIAGVKGDVGTINQRLADGTVEFGRLNGEVKRLTEEVRKK